MDSGSIGSMRPRIGSDVLILPSNAAAHLRAACSEMDLLLQTEQIDEALTALVSLLSHLGTVRSAIS